LLALRPQHRRAREQPAQEARSCAERARAHQDRARPRVPLRAGGAAVKSLFPRIAISFWIAMTLIGAAFAVIYVTTSPSERGRRFRNMVDETIRRVAVDALEAEADGGDADEVLARFHAQTDVALYVVDDEHIHGPSPAPSGARALADRARA